MTEPTTRIGTDRPYDVTRDAVDDVTTVRGEAGASSSDVAKDAASKTTSTVAEQAGAVAGSAKEEVGRLGHEAVDAGRAASARVLDQVSAQVDVQGAKAASALRVYGEQSRALGEGRVDDAGELGAYARRVGAQLEGYASTLEDKGVAGFADDLADLARRRPGAFLLGGLVVGALGTRVIRSTKSTKTTTNRKAVAEASADQERIRARAEVAAVGVVPARGPRGTDDAWMAPPTPIVEPDGRLR